MDVTKEIWTTWKEETFGDDYMIWHDGLHVRARAMLDSLRAHRS